MELVAEMSPWAKDVVQIVGALVGAAFILMFGYAIFLRDG